MKVSEDKVIEVSYKEAEALSDSQYKVNTAFDLLFEEVMKDFHCTQSSAITELTAMHN